MLVKKFRINFFLLLLLFFPGRGALAQNFRCEFLFNSPTQAEEIALKLASFRIEIYSTAETEKKLRIEEFKTLFGQFAQSLSSPEYAMHLLDQARKTLEHENVKFLQEKKAKKKANSEEKEYLKSLRIDGNKGIMHRIEPGSFKMGLQKLDVTLTKAFEMMATPVTQIIWQRVAELAAQNLSKQQSIGINADPSKFKGATRPVEQVSYADVKVWIEALNELSKTGEPLLATIFPGHQPGDIYRLPTEAEWEFVVRGRGQYNDSFFFGNSHNQAANYGWYSENSGGTTHSVAEKISLMIENMAFFDMIGNVSEWVEDGCDLIDNGLLLGGIDPLIPPTGRFRRIRGGDFRSSADALVYYWRGFTSLENRSDQIGFRLVRAVPP